MKRLMQAMLSVALVLVTAFTFCIDTASAQPVSAPVSAPVAASCSPSGPPCQPKEVCLIAPRGQCSFTKTAQLIKVKIENLGDSYAQVILSWGGQTRTVMVPPHPSDDNPLYEFAETQRGNLLAINLSNSCYVKVSFENIIGDPQK